MYGLASPRVQCGLASPQIVQCIVLRYNVQCTVWSCYNYSPQVQCTMYGLAMYYCVLLWITVRCLAVVCRYNKVTEIPATMCECVNLSELNMEGNKLVELPVGLLPRHFPLSFSLSLHYTYFPFSCSLFCSHLPLSLPLLSSLLTLIHWFPFPPLLPPPSSSVLSPFSLHHLLLLLPLSLSPSLISSRTYCLAVLQASPRSISAETTSQPSPSLTLPT